jgi:mannose-6-phosphate isomerase-like protein (cupin superfamily)
VIVFEGDGVCEIAGEGYELTRIEATYISRGLPHRFANAGATDLRILWIHDRTDTTCTSVEQTAA